MPSLSVSFNPALGPILSLFLTPPAVLQQAVQAIATNPQVPIGVHAAQALVDTGASITSVTPQLAQTVGLPLIGKRQLGTAGGIVAANVYLADIAIPFGALPAGAPGQVMTANLTAVTIPNVTVMEFQSASPYFNMLLGRDIICTGMFTIGFDGRFTFSL